MRRPVGHVNALMFPMDFLNSKIHCIEGGQLLHLGSRTAVNMYVHWPSEPGAFWAPQNWNNKNYCRLTWLCSRGRPGLLYLGSRTVVNTYNQTSHLTSFISWHLIVLSNGEFKIPQVNWSTKLHPILKVKCKNSPKKSQNHIVGKTVQWLLILSLASPTTPQSVLRNCQYLPLFWNW